MKRQEIKVAVKNKKQAMKFKRKLEKRGEKIAECYWVKKCATSQELLRYSIDYGWFCGLGTHNINEIKFKDLLKIIDESQSEKIAVMVENEMEFVAMNNYCKENGYLSSSIKYKNWASSKIYFSLKRRSIGSAFFYGETVTPFKDFAEKYNIKTPILKSEDGVWLYEGDKNFEASNTNIDKNNTNKK